MNHKDVGIDTIDIIDKKYQKVAEYYTSFTDFVDTIIKPQLFEQEIKHHEQEEAKYQEVYEEDNEEVNEEVFEEMEKEYLENFFTNSN